MAGTTNSDRDMTIADIHKIREQISGAFGGDIRVITENARKRQAASGRPERQVPSSNKTPSANAESSGSPSDDSAPAAE
jgi:hypothetical protein